MTLIRKLNALFLLIVILTLPSQLFSLSEEETVYLARIQEGNQANPHTQLTDEILYQLHPLFLKILKKEKALSNNYYQVITGQNSLFLGYQIFLKELNAMMKGYSIPEYEYLRDDEIKFAGLHEFFDLYPDLLTLHEKIHDHQSEQTVFHDFLNVFPQINDSLISASLTLETCSASESALHVFVTGSGMGRNKEEENYIKEKMVEALEKRGVPSSHYAVYLDQWIEMLPKSTEGIITQIFISKKFAKQMLYVSLPLGLWLPESRNLQRFFMEFNRSRRTENFDIYKPVQVRILADSLCPQKAKVFQYTAIEPEVIKNYRLYIRKCLEEIFLGLN